MTDELQYPTLTTWGCKEGPTAILAGTSLVFTPTRPYAPASESAGVVTRGSGPWTIWRDAPLFAEVGDLVGATQ